MDVHNSVVAIVAIVLGIGSPVILVGLILWYKARRARMAHDTAITLAEKGQPIPPELFMTREEPYSDLRRGLVLVGLGLALCIFMLQLDKPWSIGLIPLFMGVGYLIVWKMEGSKGKGTEN
jgi:hypothetical protein